MGGCLRELGQVGWLHIEGKLVGLYEDWVVVSEDSASVGDPAACVSSAAANSATVPVSIEVIVG